MAIIIHSSRSPKTHTTILYVIHVYAPSFNLYSFLPLLP